MAEKSEKQEPEKLERQMTSSGSSGSTGSSTFSTIICTTSEIQGNVIFGKGCIIHPGCSIICEGGDIIIGDFNIIEERVVIYNKILRDKSGNFVPRTMKIGNFNLFEVGSILESSDVGDYNTFQYRSHVEINCQINNGCTIGAGVRIPQKSTIENQMSAYYPGKTMKNLNFHEESHKINILGMYDFLSKVIPKNNQLRKL